jgi:hypothetical protein
MGKEEENYECIAGEKRKKNKARAYREIARGSQKQIEYPGLQVDGLCSRGLALYLI